MSTPLDAIDQQLLSLLHANAREPAALLARKLGIARTTVVARIARLERHGTVAGYGLRLGQRVEQQKVRAYCGLSVTARTGEAVLRALARMPEIEELCSVSGSFDYMALLRCETPEQLDALLDRIGAIEGVKQTHTSVVLSRKLDRRSAAATVPAAPPSP